MARINLTMSAELKAYYSNLSKQIGIPTSAVMVMALSQWATYQPRYISSNGQINNEIQTAAQDTNSLTSLEDELADYAKKNADKPIELNLEALIDHEDTK